MSTSTHTATEQAALGAKVVGYALDGLRLAAAAAFAWGFTTWWSIAIALVLSYIGLVIVSVLAVWGINAVCDSTPLLTAVGGAAFAVSDKVSGWFKRAPAVTA